MLIFGPYFPLMLWQYTQWNWKLLFGDSDKFSCSLRETTSRHAIQSFAYFFYMNRKLCTMTITGPAGSYSELDGYSPKTQSLSFSSLFLYFFLYMWKCTSDFVSEILCAFNLSHTHATCHVYIFLCFFIPCTHIISGYSGTEYLSVTKKCFVIENIWKDQLSSRRKKFGMAFILLLMLKSLHVPSISILFYKCWLFGRGYWWGGCLNTTGTRIMGLCFSYSLTTVRGLTYTQLFYIGTLLLIMLYLYQFQLFTWKIKRTEVVFVKGSVVRYVD
jgi:hypothetical protein